METWEITILTGCVSIISGVVASFVTSKITHRNEVKNHILQERTKFYLDSFPLIDLLINKEKNICDYEYMTDFISLKANMKLLSSKQTFEAYGKVFDLVIGAYNAIDIYNGYKNNEDISKFSKEDYAKVKGDMSLSESEYLEKYMPDRDKLIKLIDDLYEEMRNDLGSNMK